MCHQIKCLHESHLQSSTACPKGMLFVPFFSSDLAKNSLFQHKLLSFCFPISRLKFQLLTNALKFSKWVACGRVQYFIVLSRSGFRSQ